MPFRHLLFARNGGAPRRNPGQVVPTLDEQRFFDPDNEVSVYNRLQWPEGQGGYVIQQSPMEYNTPIMQNQSTKQQNSEFSHPFDHQSSMYTANTIPYQRYPDWDSNSIVYSDTYSSDLAMDTDTYSSVSHDSVHSSSSSAHLDVMYDTDSNSLHSISRKPSTISNHSVENDPTRLCPAILSGGKCNPSQCGPNAPCLQYVNSSDVQPIEDFSSNSNYQVDAGNQPIDFTTPHTSPQRQAPLHAKAEARQSVDLGDTAFKTRPRRPTTKSSGPSKDEPGTLKQTKKTRARQAHSLVERKYREGLNNRINQLFELLQQARASRSGGVPPVSGGQDEDAESDDDDQSRTSSLKVKKSDVLVEAMNYVHSTQRELKQKDDEIEQLQERVKMMENWIRSGQNQRQF